MGRGAYNSYIHVLEGRFRAEGELLHNQGVITRFRWLEAFGGKRWVCGALKLIQVRCYSGT